MSYYFRDVKKFHDKFKLVTPATFSNLASDLLVFRVKFMEEEYQEYVDSCKDDDLATAIDSLIDLVYITCGTAIYHGITAEEWDNIVVDEDALFNIDDSVFSSVDEPIHLKPAFLSPAVNVAFTYHLRKLIAQYMMEASSGCGPSEDVLKKVHGDQYYATLAPQQEEIKRLLGALYASILAGASYMGISLECWDEMWNDVQRANMQKERVMRVEDSKRGSIYDVRKPIGWVAPRSEEILAKYL